MAKPTIIIASADLLKQAVTEHVRACEKIIARSERPTDVFPLDALAVLFVVHEDHIRGWDGRIDSMVWDRVAQLTDHCFLCPYGEQVLQSEYFALTHQELTEFRRGVPILKIAAAIDTRTILARGGRTKHDAEIKLRNALSFEVFRQDIAVGALLAGQDDLDGKRVKPDRGSGLQHLCKHSWVDGVPFKGHARQKALAPFDRKLTLMGSLRDEGEAVAATFVAGAVEPKQVVDMIIKQVAASTTTMRTPKQFEDALAAATSSVKTLMRACAHITELSEGKVGLSRETHKADERIAKREEKERNRSEELASGKRKRDRWRSLDPIPDPMTKAMHQTFTRFDFSPEELLIVASLAGIDPNLLCSSHVLATPEFRLAQMLRKMSLGEEYKAGDLEMGVLRNLFFSSVSGDLYRNLCTPLTSLALECFPRDWWVSQLTGT